MFSGEPNYISIIISPKNKPNTNPTNNSKNFQSLCLCSTQYVYDIFKFIPKTFKISTNNGLEYFNIDILKDCSSVINNLLKTNPNELQYNLDIKDEENVLGKFAQIFQGESVLFEEESLLVSFKITRLLNIVHCPNFMKPDSLRSKESFGTFSFSIKKRETRENNVEINHISFNSFLKNQPTNTFTILTKKNEYKCNKYGVYSSKIIREIIEKDPTVDKYVYDYSDEFNEFQFICDIFNFSTVEVNKNNMDSLKEIIDDLQITYLSDPITKIIGNYDNFSQTVDDQQVIIDSIEEVFHWLYTIKDFSVANARNKIIQSKWVQTEENVQELAAFILQVIKSDIFLHKYIADLLIELDNAANKTNYLKILLPFITEKLMISLGRKTTICSFIYILYKKGIISKESLINRIKIVLATNMNNNEKELIQGKNIDINQINANNISIWFLPELLTIPRYKYYIDKEGSLANQSISIRVIGFIKSFLPDKIHLYEKMRESGEPSDPITKALLSDDVDELQSIITKTRINFTKCSIPFNMFDDFDFNDEQKNFLNYAAAHGSLRCFKYLLLNHAEIDKDTFSCAVFGGNIEIIKIVDQNKKDIKINNNKTFSFKNKNDLLIDKIVLPAIAKHQNDLFDWIIDQNSSDASKKILLTLII